MDNFLIKKYINLLNIIIIVNISVSTNLFLFLVAVLISVSIQAGIESVYCKRSIS